MNRTFCVRADPGLMRRNNEDAVLINESCGLADMVDDVSMVGLMIQEKNIVKLATELIDLANAKSGRDNIRVILIHAQATPDKPCKSSCLLEGWGA